MITTKCSPSWSVTSAALYTRMAALACMFALFLQVLGAPLPGPDEPASILGKWREVTTADQIVVSITLIVGGLLFTFWGGKMFRVCLFVVGAFVLSSVAFSVLGRIETANGVFNHRKAVYLGVGLAAGIVGGMLFTFFYKLGIFAIGVFGGYTFALWILTAGSNGLISSDTGRTVFIVVCAIVGGVLVFVAEPHVIRISTAFGGSYVLFLGIDGFAKTGFQMAAMHFLGAPSTDFRATGPVYGMFAGTLVVAIIGAIVQYRRGETSYRSIRK